MLLAAALLPRVYGALNQGWHWDAPGSFTLINFDEGGSCRAALGHFEYSPFVGHQTIAIASLLGHAPPAAAQQNPGVAKQYCHSAEHIRVGRMYSAVLGSLTVVCIALIGLLLLPQQPVIGLTAGWLLASSGFHVVQSHMATVDAPSTFFIHLLLLFAVLASTRQAKLWWLTPALLLPAVWTKYWVFALFAYVATLPASLGKALTAPLKTWQWFLLPLLTAWVVACAINGTLPLAGFYVVAVLFYLLLPWRKLPVWVVPLAVVLPPSAWWLGQLPIVQSYAVGNGVSPFGSGYAVIGGLKWLRNAVNVPLLLTVSFGLPAVICMVLGLRRLWRQPEQQWRGWLCLTPVLLFLLFMLWVSPITYYRHYLPLLPAAALLAALGFWQSSLSRYRWALGILLLWPLGLLWDTQGDYIHDPRVELRDWFDQHTDSRAFVSYYVSPPVRANARAALFRPEFARGDAAVLLQAHYLILSENWYDTAFANELNGPLVQNKQRLIKTTPADATFYRTVLAGEHPLLTLESEYRLVNFMPELLLHKAFYGTFQMFTGDIFVYRVAGTQPR